MRTAVSDALHWLAHRIYSSKTVPCDCEFRAYQRGWRIAHQAQEQRYRLIRAGVDVESADKFERWLREHAA